MTRLFPVLALVLAAGMGAGISACTTVSDTKSSGPAAGADAGGGTTAEGGAPGPGLTGTTDCTKTVLMVDGWKQIIGPDYVELSREDALVELDYAITLDAALLGDGHVIENLWTRVLGSRFTTGARNTSDEHFIYGPATETASGTPVFIGFANVSSNGVARPVAGIAKDEATFNALFANGDALFAMHRYNFFPLACGSVVGSWSTSFSVAGASASSVTGISVSSHRLDLSFADTGAYHRDESANVDTKSEKVIEDGTFAAGDYALVLTSDAAKIASFDAGYVALRGGLALSLVNREFTGQRDLLLRGP
ncbi:hypothetical protein BH11MYX4_BH11MYX4_06490 [soil metagenome]